MFSSFTNSWKLTKSSFAILMSEKKLLIIPFISTIVLIGIMAVFAVPFFLASGITAESTSEEGMNFLGYVVLFFYYMVSYTIVIFFNSILVDMVLKKISGLNASFSESTGVVLSKIVSILGYAFIASTVGVILSVIRDKGGLLGKIFAFFGGMAWNLATFFVVPILVTQNIGPIQAIKKSGGLFKSTWGEQVVGNFTIGGATVLLMIPIMIVTTAIIVAGAAVDSLLIIILGAALMVVSLIVISLVSSVLSIIYQTILYKFATDKTVPVGFDPTILQNAFRAKRRLI